MQKFYAWWQGVLHSPFGLQCVCLTLFIAFIFGFQPPYSHQGWYFSITPDIAPKAFLPLSESGFLKNNIGVDTSGLGEILVEDEDGNMVTKVLPRKRSERITYKVKSGDNISRIAHKFGLKVSTILWANKKTSKQTLSVGEKLIIPPTDGVYYTVKEGDTLGEIAKAHSIELTKIKAYNPVKNNVIRPGQEVFLPEATKRYIVQKRRPVLGGTFIPGSQPVISVGSLSLMRPAKGILTQGYKPGHYAIDIASKLNTPIYAAEGGKVIKSESSGWNYGYGRYVVIDHGNGIETLYGHNNIVKVSVGDTVRKGQLIALMGNTGRVFGRTGIHLHFEVRINGRKVNPYNYFR